MLLTKCLILKGLIQTLFFALPIFLAQTTSTNPTIQRLALDTIAQLPGGLTGAFALSEEDRMRVLSALQAAGRTPRIFPRNNF